MREMLTDNFRSFFYRRLSGGDLDSCWPWTGYINGDGYGQLCFKRKTITVQRVAYTLFWGEIPDGRTIDHMCRNRRCGNPYHLRALTNRQNVLAGICSAAQNARKTHCIRGHSLAGENLLVVRGTDRSCRACAKIHKDAWNSRNR
jgi:hypothetical protein